MFGLSRKKSAGMAAPAGPRIPTEKVVSLSSRGLSEPEIIKTLREEGFSPLDVDRAMKEALRTGTGVQAPPGPQPAPAAPPLPPAAGPPGPAQSAPPPYPAGPPSPAAPPAPGQPPSFSPFPQDQYAPTVWETEDEMMEEDIKLPKERKIGPEHFLSEMDETGPPPGPEGGREPLPFTEPPLPKGRDDRIRELKDRKRREVEELTEEVTEEKWSDMMSRIQNLEDRVGKMAADVKTAATQVPGPGAPPGELDTIRNEIESQKHSVEDVNARIDSLEEVVKGSLTPMVESIRKFSHAVKGTKPEAPQPAPPIQPPKLPPAPEQKPAEMEKEG